MSQLPNADPSSSKPKANALGIPKAIGSLAKKQDDVTRQGTQKLKFVPTLPMRRKKTEGDVKQEETAGVIPSASTARARGRGRGRGRGGEGRGGVPPPARAPVEMTASGPFALGPAMAGTSTRRAAPRSNFTPIVPLGPGNASSLGAGLTKTTAPSLKTERVGVAQVEKDLDAYSDPDDGVEIVDMENVRRMDWMAPEILRKEKESGKKQKKDQKLKQDTGLPTKGKMQAEAMDEDNLPEGDVDLANALNLSDSEEEEKMEDLIDEFAMQDMLTDDETNVRAEKLYFFQFPEPFPKFIPSSSSSSHEPDAALTADKGKGKETEEHSKKVTFSEDTKSGAPSGAVTPATATPGPESAEPAKITLDGVIGRLEIYQSGAVKMRLGNGMVFDVTAATQPSFLQHAVHLDLEHKRLNVLGEVNRRFVVSPNIDSLLEKLDQADRDTSLKVNELDDPDLLKMDMS